MRKRVGGLMLCLALTLLLGGCARRGETPSPTAAPEAPRSIAAEPDAEAAMHFTATLYFRYENTALLRQEAREMTLLPNETREKALVSALLEGSRQTSGEALFPEGTQVLSTQTQGDVVYVTMNEALYDRYEGEGRSDGDAALRRRIALAALAATLTEDGGHRSVQVLVRPEEAVGTSMRLKQSFYGGEDETAAAPLTRQTEFLPTPANYALAFLNAWQTRDWSQIYVFLAQRAERPALSAAVERFNASPALCAYSVAGATVALDGQSAVANVSCTVRDGDGVTEREIADFPLRMEREDGAWRVSMAQAIRLMGGGDE